MKKLFSPKQPKLRNNDSQAVNILTSPLFVVGLVVVCFAILTPKIFMPLFMQIFGLNTPQPEKPIHHIGLNDPRMRSGMPNPHAGDSRAGPQFGRPPPGPMHGQGQAPAATSSNKGGLLSFLLPVYAVGIGVYMMYTLYKVFKKEDPKEEVDSDYDDIKEKRNFKFKEHKPNNGFGVTKGMSERSEETEDELNEYARYKDLDPEYVAYLKQVRRQKRLENKNLAKNKKPANVQEITLTPGSGLTSITNTNVLMNDTLERMKHQLNKINGQLVEVEQKGSPLQDPELESLKLQLTQTEMQMAKIMTIVNNVSETLDMQAEASAGGPSKGYDDYEDDEEDSDDFEEEEAYHQSMLAHSLQMQYMNGEVNQEVSKSTLRNRRKNQKKQQKKLSLQQEESESISSSSISSANAMHSNYLRDQNSSENDDENQEIVLVNQKRNQVNANKQTNVNNNNGSAAAAAAKAKNQQKNAKKKQKKKSKAKQHES